MADEEKFDEYLNTSAAFTNVKLRFMVRDPRNSRYQVEVDNVGQKGRVLYIFEGNRGSPDLNQLAYRFLLFSFQRTLLCSSGFFTGYDIVRVFYYNLKKQRLIEYSRQGQVVQTFAYSTTPELIG